MKKWIFTAVVLAIVAIGAWVVLRPGKPAGAPSANPTPSAPELPPEQKSHIETTLEKMSLEQKVASLLVLHASGTNAVKLGAFADKYQPGGFILMGDNIPNSDAALQKETAALRGDDEKLPRLVAIDQEGGIVRRLKGDSFPAAGELRNLPVQAAEDAFSKRSAMVQSVGVTLNFGIIADVTSDKSSFIYPRVLGISPHAAADRVAAAVRGTKGKTLSTLKHFPGHGESEADSHHSIPSTPISYDAWRNKDALPFASGIKAGADVIMMGHLRYSAVDDALASLSKKWHDILRNDLHFDGVIITDDMCMLQNSGASEYRDPGKNAVRALNAGNDLLLYVLDNAGSPGSEIDPQTLIRSVVQAVERGDISEKRIDEAAKKALELRAHSAEFIR